MTVAGLLVAGILASSCSLDAAIETDTGGRVIGINALRIQSRRARPGLRARARRSQLILELRWRRDPAETSRLF